MRQQWQANRKFLGALVVGIGFAIQVIPVPGGSVRAAAPGEPGRPLEMPAPVQVIFNKACRDCHTNETAWPWYGRVAPMSWMLARDVHQARAAANFSEWTTQAGRTPAKAIATLSAACANMRSGRMPLPGYRLMHPESRLSEPEIDLFCSWTGEQTKAWMLTKRKSAGAGQP